MATKRWVANTSPLLLLGKIDRLALLEGLADEVVIPRAVLAEIDAKPVGKATLQAIAHTPSFVVVDNATVTPEVLSWDLGPGETQVIAQALGQPADRVVLDDREARRCAMAMGLRIIGTLGIVGRAQQAGLIDQARPVISRLRAVGLYVTDALVQQLLSTIGEE